MKPMLACDYDPSKLRFPVIAMPKIDGVRALHLGDQLTGRSLKTHGNRYVTSFFTSFEFQGFDGEMAAQAETHPDLCRITSSALASREGEPFVLWWLFDWVSPVTKDLPYHDRLVALAGYVSALQSQPNRDPAAGHLRLVPWKLCNNIDELEDYDEANLDAGYEGTIVRDPQGKYKEGRSTAREGGYLRIKRFVEADARVVSITEGQQNGNEAQVNELGQQFRTTHQANMVPNGMVGNMQCVTTEDVMSLNGKSIIIPRGQEITVSPGKMPHADRKRYFENQDLLVGKTIKFKFFPVGIKDKPRFPTFNSLRIDSDKVG